METIYRSRFTGSEFVIEKIVNDHMVAMRSTDGLKRICTDKGNLKLFYDKTPTTLITPIDASERFSRRVGR
jgi:hypothetical protein